MKSENKFGLCICTFRRSKLLKLLIEDCLAQSLLPEVIIIVDGDPTSEEVLTLLNEIKWPEFMKVVYIASNHGNQTYQRYLGLKIAQEYPIKGLLYLDDDLRTSNNDSIKNIVNPIFIENSNIVAVTAKLLMGRNEKLNTNEISLDEFRKSLNSKNIFIKLFGSSQKYQPGELTPVGNRIPISSEDEPYVSVKWLRGGAMAFRLTALSEKIFSDDIFAMNHLKYGLCEDLIISRRLLCKGGLLFSNSSIFLHPNEDPPKAYSTKSFHFGTAFSYSRRWINDNYRGEKKPFIKDRVALIISYFGGFLLHWVRAISQFNKQKAIFALGYSKGIFLALFIKPSSKRLTPNIDWWQDATEALKGKIRIR